MYIFKILFLIFSIFLSQNRVFPAESLVQNLEEIYQSSILTAHFLNTKKEGVKTPGAHFSASDITDRKILSIVKKTKHYSENRAGIFKMVSSLFNAKITQDSIEKIFRTMDEKFPNILDLCQQNFDLEVEESSSDQKNICMTNFSPTTVFESGYQSQMTSPIAVGFTNSCCLSGHQAFEFCKFSQDPFNFEKSPKEQRREAMQNVLLYVQSFWGSDFSEEEKWFLGLKKSHFLNTIHAAKILLNARNDMVVFEDNGEKEIIVTGGDIYLLLKRLQENNGSIDDITSLEFEEIFKNLETFSSTPRNSIASVGDNSPIHIFGGLMYDLLKPKAKIASKTKEIGALAKKVVENLHRNLFSRWCSEQKAILDLWLRKDSLDESPQTFLVDTYKYPCPTCLMTFGRAKRLIPELDIQILYHTEYKILSAKDVLCNQKALDFATENGVRIEKIPEVDQENENPNVGITKSTTPDRSFLTPKKPSRDIQSCPVTPLKLNFDDI